jgi:hypothetical protein
MKTMTQRLVALAVIIWTPIAYATPICWDIGGNNSKQSIDATSYIGAGVVEDLTGGLFLNDSGGSGSFARTNSGFIMTVTRTGGGSFTANKFTNNLLDDYIWGGAPYSVQIEGLSTALSANTTYYLYLFGVGDSANQNAQFVFDGVTNTTPTVAPPSLPDSRFAKFTFNTGPVVSDTLTFEVRQVSSQVCFNGLVIVQQPATSPPTLSATTPAHTATGVWMSPAVQAQVQDGLGNLVDPSTMILLQNGVQVATGGSKAGSISTINWTNTTILPPGATITNTVIYGDGIATSWTNSWTWTVYNYQTLPASYALAVPASTPGMVVNVFQTDTAPASGPAAVATIAMAEQQFGGGLLDGLTPASSPLPNVASPASGAVSIINYELTGSDAPGESFSSTTAPAGAYANNFFTGIPGSSFSYLSFTHEVNAYLRLSNGAYRMVVNSDDGFKVSVAPGLNNPDGLQLGGFLSGGKGPSDVPVDFVVTNAGDYPFRVLYYQASGGASFEWFMQNMTTGEKVLINDVANPNAVLAFQNGSSRATVTKMLPANGFQSENSQAIVEFAVRNGTTALTGTPVLQINGTPVTPAITSSGGVTTVKWTNSVGFAFGSTNTARLIWTENTAPATTWTNTTTFRIANYAVANMPPNTFWFELEDWDFGGGQFVAAANDPSTYLGGGYQQDGGETNGTPYVGVLNVDYFQGVLLNDGSAGADYSYRGNYGATNRIGLENRIGSLPTLARPNGLTVSQNYNVGWNDVGEWCNYTRTLSNGVYRAYASIAGPNAGFTASALSIVRSGVGTTNQTLQSVGLFSSQGTGGWQNYQLIPLIDANGNPAAIYVNGAGGSNTMTFRYNMRATGSQPINNDWVALVPATNVPPVIISASPANGTTGVTNTAALQYKVQVYDRPVNNAGVTLNLNGSNVTPTFSGPDANGILTINYAPGTLPVGTNTFSLIVPDTGSPAPVVTTTNAGSFVVAGPVQPPATNITWTVTGDNKLVLTWPNGVGWRLESQTNSLGVGLSTNWVNVPGATSPHTNVLSAPALFYRLVNP